jgi:hypothetical protein
MGGVIVGRGTDEVRMSLGRGLRAVSFREAFFFTVLFFFSALFFPCLSEAASAVLISVKKGNGVLR